VGIAPDPRGLAEVSRRTGVHVVAGTGFYVASSYAAPGGPGAWAAGAPVEALADHLRRELLEGIAGTGVRAGLIGELGVGNPPAPVEERVLRAAARVQRELGCAVSLHPVWGAESARLTARLADESGLDPARTAISHLDVRFRADLSLYREVGARGFFLSLDTFGRDCFYPHVATQLPSDTERLDVLRGLFEAGLGGQVLVAHDICLGFELVRNGGHGYAHLLRSLRPWLRVTGGDGAALDRALVANPRRWLTGGDAAGRLPEAPHRPAVE
jgi:phosphotriesterase-related protein